MLSAAHPVLVLFAVVEGHWVFYGTYSSEDKARQMIAKLTRQHGYTRYHVMSLGAGQGQGITWS